MRGQMILLSLLAAAACTAKPAATTDSAATADTSRKAANTAQNTDDAKAAIGKIRDGWKDAANKKDSVTVANFYTDDAELVGTDFPLAKGKDAIRHSFAQSFPVSTVKSIDSNDTGVSGDVAYDYGEFTQEVTPPGQKTQTIHGYYLVALKRQSDGTWKIVRQVDTTPPKGK